MKEFFMGKDGAGSMTVRLSFAVITALVAAICLQCHGVHGPMPQKAEALMGFAMIGAVVNAATIQSLGKSFKALYTEAFDAVSLAILEVAMETTSTTTAEEYGWLGQIPSLREWIGDRHVHSLAASGYTIKNKDYEATVGVKRTDIDDDNIGIYNPIVRMMGDAAARHPGELLVELIRRGETDLCHDGKAFFATDHPNGDQAAFSNLFTSKALSAANYALVRAAMMSYVNDSGRAMGIVPNALIVPPQLEETARQILAADVILGDATAGGSKTNVWKNTAKLIMAPELAADPTAWYLAALDRPVKPLINQIRKQPEFVALTKPDDETVFSTNKFQWGVDRRGNVGYAFPQLMAKARA